MSSQQPAPRNVLASFGGRVRYWLSSRQAAHTPSPADTQRDIDFAFAVNPAAHPQRVIDTVALHLIADDPASDWTERDVIMTHRVLTSGGLNDVLFNRLMLHLVARVQAHPVRPMPELVDEALALGDDPRTFSRTKQRLNELTPANA